MGNAQRVEIFDQREGFLAFDLRDVLMSLPSVASELDWHLLDIEAVGKGLSGESILATEARASSSPDGISLRFAELQQFSDGLEQTINAKILGLPSGSSLGHSPPPIDSIAKFVLIEMVDSTFGAVTSDFPDVIECIRDRFGLTTLSLVANPNGFPGGGPGQSPK